MTDKYKEVLASIASDPSSISRVDLSNCDLTEFPRELFAVAATLEFLNLGGNKLSSLPDDFASFQKLRTIFFANNDFESFPPVLGKMRSLFMVSFKSNKLKSVASESLSPSISWLILTDNMLTGIKIVF